VIRANIIEDFQERTEGLFFELEIDFLIDTLLKLLERQLLTRGIITIGDSFQSKKVFFGPAIIRAHNLEKDKVIYPRICIDKRISDKIFVNDDTSYDKLKLANMLTEDFDGMFFIDYLKFIFYEWLYHVEKGFSNIGEEILKVVLSNSKSLISASLKTCKEEYETKIFWLKNYHNRTIKKFAMELKEKSTININNYLLE
jgi:hypothetical protein